MDRISHMDENRRLSFGANQSDRVKPNKAKDAILGLVALDLALTHGVEEHNNMLLWMKDVFRTQVNFGTQFEILKQVWNTQHQVVWTHLVDEAHKQIEGKDRQFLKTLLGEQIGLSFFQHKNPQWVVEETLRLKWEEQVTTTILSFLKPKHHEHHTTEHINSINSLITSLNAPLTLTKDDVYQIVRNQFDGRKRNIEISGRNMAWLVKAHKHNENQSDSPLLSTLQDRDGFEEHKWAAMILLNAHTELIKNLDAQKPSHETMRMKTFSQTLSNQQRHALAGALLANVQNGTRFEVASPPTPNHMNRFHNIVTAKAPFVFDNQPLQKTLF